MAKKRRNQKPEKDYQAIIAQLENILSHTVSMAAGGDEIWLNDARALDEAISIIHDYDMATKQTAQLMRRYEVPEAVRQIEADLYTCPMCGRRLQWGDVHCRGVREENRMEVTQKKEEVYRMIGGLIISGIKWLGLTTPCAQYVMVGIATILEAERTPRRSDKS